VGGRVLFFFGDTSPCDDRYNREFDDCIAWSNAQQDPEFASYLGKGPLLHWTIGADGLSLQPIRIQAPEGDSAVDVSWINYGGLAVPTGPFTVREDTGDTVYVYYTQPTNVDTTPPQFGWDILARSDDGGNTFHLVYQFPFPDFVNISSVVAPDEWIAPHQANISGPCVFVFGTGTYRHSNVYLAYCLLDRLEDIDITNSGGQRGPSDQWHFFAGFDGAGEVIWASDSTSSQPLFLEPVFGVKGYEDGTPGIGELSVAYEPNTRLWIMIYAFPDNTVHARYAQNPWGPWDALGLPEVIFDAAGSYGPGGFIHDNLHVNGPDTLNQIPGSCQTPCPTWACGDVPAGIYAPYMIPSWFKVGPRDLTVYYTLSTWRPYQTLLMKSILQIVCWG
jgi:hypothetical protein